MGVFETSTASFDLGELPCKEKTEILSLFIENGGNRLFSISHPTDFLVVTGKQWSKNSFKIRFARKLSIPVVDVSYIQSCINKRKLLPTYLFAPCPEIDTTTTSNLSLSSDHYCSEERSTPRTATTVPKVTPEEYFPNNDTDSIFALASSHFLLKLSNSHQGHFCALELHAHNEILNKTDFSLIQDLTSSFYRVFIHTGTTNDLLDPKSQEHAQGTKQFFSLNSIDDAEAFYAHLLDKYTKILGYREYTLSSPRIGSELQKNAETLAIGNSLSVLPQSVQELVTEIYEESEKQTNFLLDCNDTIAISPILGKIDIEDIRRAEILLCNAWNELGSGNILPLSERNTTKFQKLKQEIIDSAQNQEIRIKEIFEIQQEEKIFDCSAGNVKRLFHGSCPGNLLGLLSRGFLIPCGAESSWYLKGSRRDVGMLGAGIYFADDAAVASRYSQSHSDSKFILVVDVALGNTFSTLKFDTSLTEPPNGYNSVHGVKRQNSNNYSSDFSDNEFVIYNSLQQTIRYLVQLQTSKQSTNQANKTKIDISHQETKHLQAQLQIASKSLLPSKIIIDEKIENQPLPTQEIENITNSALISSCGGLIPLKSSHVRAKILDMVATVNIFQEYKNETNAGEETKFVFPLDSHGAVCGFEAFINGKHIVGKVKEKHKAHREYNESIQRGAGAYLMHQNDNQNSWTVSVGNLPPGATVVIKITYVTELCVEGDTIIFRLPAVLSGTAKKRISQKITQTMLPSTVIDSSNLNILQSLCLTLEMPYEIMQLFSPSHREDLMIKSTDTKASVQMKPSILSLHGKDFEFHIKLANAHEPRMWIEESNEGQQRAAMLCFYPRFEFSPLIDNEFLFVIDCSSSMGDLGLSESHRISRILLQRIPEGSKVNFLVFGSYSEDCFFTSQLNTTSTIKYAQKWLKQKLKQPKGATNLFKVLKRIFLRANHKRAPRNIFLLSDGEIQKFNDVLTLVKHNSHHTRLFSIGIGLKQNRNILSSLSRVGHGFAEFFDTAASAQFLDGEKVLNLIRKALQPAISNVELEWVGDACEVQQAPNQILSVFNGERKVIYGMLGKELCSQVILRSMGADGEQIHTRVASHCVSAVQNDNDLIHKLAVRALLRDYEEGNYSENLFENSLIQDSRRHKMIQLSCKYNVACSLTSFLAIEERNSVENFSGTSQLSKLLADTPADCISYVPWNENFNMDIDRMHEETNRLFVVDKNKFAGSGLISCDDLCDKFQLEIRRRSNEEENFIIFPPKKKRKASQTTRPTELPVLSEEELNSKYQEFMKSLKEPNLGDLQPASVKRNDAVARLEYCESSDSQGDLNVTKRKQLRQLAQINGTRRESSSVPQIETPRLTTSVKSRWDEVPKHPVTSANSDLRKLSFTEMENFLLKNGLRKGDIDSMTHWERLSQVRKISSNQHTSPPENYFSSNYSGRLYNPSRLNSARDRPRNRSRSRLRSIRNVKVQDKHELELTSTSLLFDSALENGNGILEECGEAKSIASKIQFSKLLELQYGDGFWSLSEELENLAGIPNRCLFKVLESVDYQNLPGAKQELAERQLATAIVIELFLRDGLRNGKIQLAIDWLARTEREEVSTCYQLGISCNWRAKSSQILIELSLKGSYTSFNPLVHYTPIIVYPAII